MWDRMPKMPFLSQTSNHFWSSSKWARRLLKVLFFVGVFSSILCNEKPLLVDTDEGLKMPAFKELLVDWVPGVSEVRGDYGKGRMLVRPPIPYSYDFIDGVSARYRPPFSNVEGGWYKTHWLGTDLLGRDVLSGIIRGLQVAIKVAFLSTLFALIFGSVFGFMAAFFGDQGYRSSWQKLILILVSLLIGLYLMVEGVYADGFDLLASWPLVLPMVACILTALFVKIDNNISLPIDTLLLRVIEFRKSISAVIILLAILPVLSRPSILSIVVILFLLAWPSFSRYARAEGLRIKEEGYFLASVASGVNFIMLFKNHFWPNAKNTLLVVFAFVLCGNIIVEASLSYLGIGLPAAEVSWGSMINGGRQNINAWWLSVFPGLMMFFVIFAVNKLRTS